MIYHKAWYVGAGLYERVRLPAIVPSSKLSFICVFVPEHVKVGTHGTPTIRQWKIGTTCGTWFFFHRAGFRDQNQVSRLGRQLLYLLSRLLSPLSFLIWPTPSFISTNAAASTCDSQTVCQSTIGLGRLLYWFGF